MKRTLKINQNRRSHWYMIKVAETWVFSKIQADELILKKSLGKLKCTNHWST